MASQNNSYTFGYPTPPSSSDTRLRWWWSRPIVTMPAHTDRAPTFKEHAVFTSPFWVGLLTTAAIFMIFSFTDKAHSHAEFSIKSISPSAATYRVDFLVKNPSSRYSIYYDDGDASVRFGHINVAVFSINRERIYSDHTTFSLAFDAGAVNRTDVISQELHIKLRGKHKRYVYYDEAGHFDIRCQILTRSHENIEKIKCNSCFTHLTMFV